jgi:hypothetical protein
LFTVSEVIGVWEDNIEMGLRKIYRKVWIGFVWLGIGTNGGLL